jgi:hypothetical protein
MNKKDIIKYALANALWTALYIILIAIFFNNAQAMFGNGKTILIPIVMLLLFVFSATLCGALVLGRPILWYLDGKKKEAITLFIYTTVVLLVVTVLMMIVLYTLK